MHELKSMFKILLIEDKIFLYVHINQKPPLKKSFDIISY